MATKAVQEVKDTRTAQERMDKRTWLDFMDARAGRVGVDVKVKPFSSSASSASSSLAEPDGEAMSHFVRAFLWRAGIACEKAVPVGTGATTGPVAVAEVVFEHMKLIGPTIQLVKFALAWHARVAARKRRQLFPRVVVTLLADHIEPRSSGPDEWQDMANTLVLVLPELQRELEAEYSTCCFEFEFRARGQKVTRFTLRAGAGLPVTDSNVLQMMEHLEKDVPSLTLFHIEGWFAFPKVMPVSGVVRPLNVPPEIPPVRG